MNEQTPFGFFPGNPGGNFPNQPSQQCHCTREIRNINNRLNNIENQISRLDRRVRRLEFSNRPTPYGASTNQSDFSASYDNDNYII